jgi:hypothetical protein
MKHDVDGVVGEGGVHSPEHSKMMEGSGGVKPNNGGGRRSGSSSITSATMQQATAVLSRGHVAGEGGVVIASHVAQHACEVCDVY